MKTKVTFEVLVSNGNIVKADNAIEWHRMLKEGRGFGREVDVELRSLVVEGGMEDAYKAALNAGGAWWKNMKYNTIEED